MGLTVMIVKLLLSFLLSDAGAKHYLIQLEDSDVDEDYKIPKTNANDYSGQGDSTECGRCGVEKHCEGTPIDMDYIYGGEETKRNQYPWTVSLQQMPSSKHFCAGTLIASKYVLTAGHCLARDCNKKGKCAKVKKDNLTVIIGDHDLWSHGETCLDEKTLRVAKVILHEDYLEVRDDDGNVVNMENDIGLLELAEAVDLATYTPACLPSKGEAVDGKGPFYIYGWGKGSDSGRLYRIVVENLEEKQIYSEPLGQMLESKNLPLVSIGSGDSGGPLTSKQRGQHVLMGASSGYYNYYNDRELTSMTSTASYFTQISHYTDWLDSNMKDPQFCQHGAAT